MYIDIMYMFMTFVNSLAVVLVTFTVLYELPCIKKATMWFPNRPDINRLVQAQTRARTLKFQISVEEELYYPSSENKGADQQLLRS